jgi:N-acetylglucosaminyl-diphospho-decaprenol L-rhamnosyltransferase
MVDVSVIVVSYNTRELLKECITSVRETCGLSVEIVVVDNASKDGSAEAIALHHQEVSLVRNATNVGFARAVNQGLRLCRGRFALLLNSDARLSLGALDAMVGFMEAFQDVGILGPQLRYPDGALQPSGRSIPSLSPELYWSLSLHRLRKNATSERFADSTRDYEVVMDVDEVSGACMLIRREMWESIGLLHEKYFFGHEDMDYCIQARRSGWRVVYYPRSKVVHHWGRSASRADVGLKAKYLKGYYEYIRRVHGPSAATAFRILFTLKFVGVFSVAPILYLRSPNSARERVRDAAALLRATLAR